MPSVVVRGELELGGVAVRVIIPTFPSVVGGTARPAEPALGDDRAEVAFAVSVSAGESHPTSPKSIAKPPHIRVRKFAFILALANLKSLCFAPDPRAVTIANDSNCNATWQ
ncbi:MAG: hypothetical protein R3B96_25345 [Pirellulaceae bacterium]